jgi:hypothetical protein
MCLLPYFEQFIVKRTVSSEVCYALAYVQDLMGIYRFRDEFSSGCLMHPSIQLRYFLHR